ncbi:hypothetical protein FK268_17480 [Tsukamurella sputi]|uniref:Uncharacterized protein n=1 Tax=Tsukamurella sputi TaxID=2591848 RepID=A0A5C5RJ68_9ACTN|nr:hypothetical protein [Tsukamurella sputi]TWS22800.1 hypothetical protein FK268_17480 [Tsukamurella sputi]
MTTNTHHHTAAAGHDGSHAMTAPQPSNTPLQDPNKHWYPSLHFRFADRAETLEQGAAIISALLTGFSKIPSWGTGTWTLSDDHVSLASLDPTGVEAALDHFNGQDERTGWTFHSTAKIRVEFRFGIPARGRRTGPERFPHRRDWSCGVSLGEPNVPNAIPPEMYTGDALLAATAVFGDAITEPNSMVAGYYSASQYDSTKSDRIHALEQAKKIEKVDWSKRRRLSWLTGLPVSTPIDRSLLPDTATTWEHGGLNYVRLCEDPSQVTARQIGDLSEAIGLPRIERIVDLTGLTKEQARAYTGPIFLDLPDAQGSS